MREPSMRWQVVAPALAYVAARGVDVHALLRDLNLAPDIVTRSEVMLPIGVLESLLERASTLIGEAHLGLCVAETAPAGRWDVAEFAARSAATLGAGLMYVVRYAPLFNHAITVTLTPHDTAGNLRLEQRVMGHPRCTGRVAGEFWLASVLRHARTATGRACVPLGVSMAQRSPRDTTTLREAFGGAPLRFDAGCNALVFARDDLDAPLVTRDDALLAMIVRFAERERAQQPSAPGVASTVRTLLAERLSAGDVSLIRIADVMGVSPRTLQRQLADEGTRFDDLLDALREALARRWVRDGDTSIDGIAARLGYKDRSAFLRAFRRWTSMTPAHYRNA